MKLLKHGLVLILLLLPIFIFKIPKYVELNDLAIIQGVGYSCHDGNKILYLKEIIPIKGEAGLEYQYEYYQEQGEKFNNLVQKIENHTKKKIYLSKVKFVVTNCDISKDVEEELKKEDIKIYYVESDIKQKLKKKTS